MAPDRLMILVILSFVGVMAAFKKYRPALMSGSLREVS